MSASPQDVFEVTISNPEADSVGSADVFQVGHDGSVTTTIGNQTGLQLVQKQELQVAANSPTIFQVFEGGVFGGGGGAATDGATAVVIEGGWAYVGREENDDADAVTSTWQIYRVPEASLGDTPLYADGNKNYDNDWTNRTNLSYSAL